MKVAFPKVNGVGRVADNDRAILVIFERPLSDDELRNLHEEIKLMEFNGEVLLDTSQIKALQ